MSNNFRVGQKVVCVDDCPWAPYHEGLIFPTKGNTYTVRGFHLCASGIGVFLEELINAPTLYLDGTVHEPAFWPSRFRPIVERKTSIAIFQRMLLPQKEDA